MNKQGLNRDGEPQLRGQLITGVQQEIFQKEKPFYASKYSGNPTEEQVLNTFESSFQKPETQNSGRKKAVPTGDSVAGGLKKTKTQQEIINKVKEKYRKILEKIVDIQPLTSRIENKLTHRQGKVTQGEKLSIVKNYLSAEKSLSDILDGDMRGYEERQVDTGTHSDNVGHQGPSTVQNVHGERWVVGKEAEKHREEIEDAKKINEGRFGHRWVQGGKEAINEMSKWRNIDNGRIDRNHEGEHKIAGRYEGMIEGIIKGQSAGESRIDRVNKGEIRLIGGILEKIRGLDKRENKGQRRILVGSQGMKEGIENIRRGENREIIGVKEEQNRIHEGGKFRVKQVERRTKEQGMEWENQEQHRIQRMKVNEGITGVLKNIDKLGEKGSGDGIMKEKEGERRIFGVHGEIQAQTRERQRAGSNGKERERQAKFRIAAVMGQIKQKLREQEKMRPERIRGGEGVQEGTNGRLVADGIERMMKQEGKERMKEEMEEYRKRAETDKKVGQMRMESGIKEKKTGWDRL